MRLYIILIALFATITLAVPLQSQPSRGVQARESLDTDVELLHRSPNLVSTESQVLPRDTNLFRRGKMTEAEKAAKQKEKDTCAICLVTKYWPEHMVDPRCQNSNKHTMCGECWDGFMANYQAQPITGPPKCPMCRGALGLGQLPKQRFCGKAP